MSGSVYFRGNDRSPGDRAVDVGKSAAEILGEVLPEVFDRFKEAAAKPADVKKGVDALFTAENLQGLPSVFGSLGLLRDEKGKTVFRVESGPLAEVLDRIEERANYGDTASGGYLADEFAKEPFGWDFEVVRLLVLSLLRAGKIEATSKGQTIDSATGVEARDTFSNNNLFRQASFRPKKGIEFEELVKASEAFRDTFGSEVRELNAGAIVAELRKEVARHEDTVASALGQLTAHRLPGGARARRRHRPDEGHPARLRGQRHRDVQRVAPRRSRTPSSAPPSSSRLCRSRACTTSSARGRRSATAWPFLRQEADITDELRAKAAALEDLLARETFSGSCRRSSSTPRRSRPSTSAASTRRSTRASPRTPRPSTSWCKTPGWADIDEDQQQKLAAPFERGQDAGHGARADPSAPLRARCVRGRLRDAIAELRRIIDGERVVTVSLGSYFAGGIETEEQLELRSTASARSARASSAPARRSSFSEGRARWTRTPATPSSAPPSGRGSSSRRTSPRSSRARSTCCAAAPLPPKGGAHLSARQAVPAGQDRRRHRAQARRRA